MRRLLSTLLVLTVLLAGCQEDAGQLTDPLGMELTAPQQASEPGTVESMGLPLAAGETAPDLPLAQAAKAPDLGPQALAAPAGGINPVVTESGQISLSVDGLGTLGTDGLLQVDKPAGATVRGAYLAAATTWTCCPPIPDGGIQLNGQPVAWQLVVNPVAPWSQWADVTALVKATIDGAPAGLVNIGVREVSGSSGIDGSILAVIFDDPAATTDNTVSLLFGGQQLSGDNFFIGLGDPLDKSDPGLRMEMSLGISFGFQQFGGGQRSLVDVNGQRLTSSAGGEDDGDHANGALLTVGGVGDSPANPPPLVGPSNERTDDELYDLVPFTNDGDQIISVHTVNPSNDDNLFFAAFFLSVAAEVVTEDPVANAGPDQTVESPASFDLDGSGSFDPDGTIVSYEWFLGATPLASGVNPTGLVLPVGTHAITLVVEDNDGLTDDDQVVVTVEPPADVTPPEISYALSGATGDNGWYVGPVTVTWTVVDNESPITATSGCDPATEPDDGTGYDFTCTATSAGGTASVTTTSFMIDQTPPDVVASLSGPLGDNGWYVGPVTVSWTVTDVTSGVATTCPDETESNDGTGFDFSCTATDQAGNEASATSPSFMIDQTDPTVTWTGNAGSYDITDEVAITCTSDDALSGIASDTCADVTGPAWSFGLGSHAFSATATDNAGNIGDGSTSFTVSASFEGTCALVELWVSHKGVANSLCVKIGAAQRADDRGNTNARDGALGAFIDEVNAQSGKKVPADKAPLLVAFAEALMSQ